MNYPYLVAPNEHRLHPYYKRLNIIGILFTIFIVLANELLIRPNLEHIKNSHEFPFKTLLLILNLEINHSMWAGIFMAITAFIFAECAIYLCLPKWKLKMERVTIRLGLPKFHEYAEVYFSIENILQKSAFYAWHKIMAKIAIILAAIPICMLINLLRSIL